MPERSGFGPDLVIAGAARSGTSSLAAQLRAHPAIDPGITKEPNFFSAEHERGPDWYDALFKPRAAGVFRMDASTSYTYPQYSDAAERLAAVAPDAIVVYVVRDPLPRAVSHYLLRRHTLRIEEAATFGSALLASSFYAEVSDYARWLRTLDGAFGENQVLVVPFEAIRRSGPEVARVVCARLGLDPPPDAAGSVVAHRNSVVEFRSKSVRRVVSSLRRSPLYRPVRSVLGDSRVRRARSLLVQDVDLPTVAEALDSCSPAQMAELHVIEERAVAAVREHLVRQDARHGLDWAGLWH